MIRFARFEIGHTPPKLPLWVGAQPPASTHIWLCVAVSIWLCVAVSIYYIYNTPNHTQTILYYIEPPAVKPFFEVLWNFFHCAKCQKIRLHFCKNHQSRTTGFLVSLPCRTTRCSCHSPYLVGNAPRRGKIPSRRFDRIFEKFNFWQQKLYDIVPIK